jgi:hypothetical protein
MKDSCKSSEQKANNIFHSHHHKYIDTFSIKFNYARRRYMRSRWPRRSERRKTKGRDSIPRSSRYIYSNISHDLPITYRNWRIKTYQLKYEAHYFYWDVFCSFCDLQVTGMLFYCGFYDCSTFFICSFVDMDHNNEQPEQPQKLDSSRNCRNFGARKKRHEEFINLLNYLCLSSGHRWCRHNTWRLRRWRAICWTFSSKCPGSALDRSGLHNKNW